MSASDTSISSMPSVRMSATSTQQPPTITSARAARARGCGSVGQRSVASVRNTSSAAARVRWKWWMRSRSYVGQADLHGGDRRDGAGQAHDRRGRLHLRGPRAPGPRTGRSPRRWRSTSSSGAGGSCARYFSVSRTHPMSIERDRLGLVVPTTNSVDPPPMSTTRNGPSRRVEVGGRAREAEPALLLAGQQLRRARRRPPRRRRRTPPGCRRHGRRDVAVMRTRVDPVRSITPGTGAARRPCARRPRGRAGPWRPRPCRAG